MQKKFRSRFRVPISIFEQPVLECLQANVFGRTLIGDEYKLLGCLRILGRGCYADDVCEFLGIGNQTVSKMFKQFVGNCSKAYFETYGYVLEGDDMDRVVEDHTRMGYSYDVETVSKFSSTCMHGTIVLMLRSRWYVTILVEFIMFLVHFVVLLMILPLLITTLIPEMLCWGMCMQIVYSLLMIAKVV